MLTYKQRYNKRYGYAKDAPHSIDEIAKDTGISKSILSEVAKRGAGAWRTNLASVRVASTGKKDPKAPRSKKMSQEQWKMARIYSFVGGGKTQKTADSDLWEKHLKSKK